MTIIHDNALLGASGSGGYKMSRSVRLRSSASAYFNRTLTTPTNNKIWTWSSWVKRGTLGAAQVLLSSDVGTSNSTWLEFGFDAANTFTVTAYTTDSNTTSAVFRDPSAWYHIVVAFDSTQATAANRCKIYVNNVQQSLTGSGFTLNAGYGINSAQAHSIGQRNWASGVGRYFDGYLTEINFIDGQQLTPSSFGSTNATTGVWQPAKYTGTYGTNGFYLNFSDNSGATATTIGKDYSGNGNNWTPNNISVTAGTTYDSMIDVPTPYPDGSTGRGNYAVLNPISNPNGPLFTAAGGNLNYSCSASAGNGPKMSVISSMTMSSGKWYCEATETSSNSGFGVSSGLVAGGTGNGPQYAAAFGPGGALASAATYSGTSPTFTTNDVIGLAFDAGALTLAIYKNGTLQGTFSGLESSVNGWFFIQTLWTAASATSSVWNFGQRPFAYTPPTGFKALNTYNLPASTITNGGKYMAATTYTGTGAARSVTNAGGFQPDLVWMKDRGNVVSHILFDSVRGTNNFLRSNTTDAVTTNTTMLTAFNNNGFSLGTDSAGAVNVNTNSYIGWQWQAGQGSTSSNTSGSITSTVSVNATAGFSVVTYTGTLSGTPVTMPTVGHGLGVAPKLIISKSRNVTGVDSGAWFVWSANTGSTDYYLRLNTTAAVASVSGGGGGTMVAPTSTVFSTPYISGTNISANNYVAYCWAEIAGFSKFGSYTGNGSTDGPFVYCGFRPRWVMVKRVDSGSVEQWNILDTSRDSYNAAVYGLVPNASSAEYNVGAIFDFLSNGFKVKYNGSPINTSGGTYIFVAFAENPFANALAR